MTSHILQPWEIMIALVMGGAVQYNDKRTLFQRRITVRKKKKKGRRLCALLGCGCEE